MDKMSKLDRLIDDAEELLINLADAQSPQIQELRDRVDQAIDDAKRTISAQVEDVSDQLLKLVARIDEAVRDYPWVAIAAGIALVGTVAFLAGNSHAKHARLAGGAKGRRID